MDPEAFLDMANQVIKLKMFPYFDIAHCVLCALHVREDLGPGKNLPNLYLKHRAPFYLQIISHTFYTYSACVWRVILFIQIPLRSGR